jgi:cell shape-determining protein MreC
MNKAELIRQTKEKYPSYTNRQIAGVIDVKQGYAAHILWKAKHTKKKENYQESFYEQLHLNKELKKEIEKLEEETRKLRYVIKFLREN